MNEQACVSFGETCKGNSEEFLTTRTGETARTSSGSPTEKVAHRTYQDGIRILLPNFQCPQCKRWSWIYPYLIRKGRQSCSYKCQARLDESRFWNFVHKSEGCWEWIGCKEAPPCLPYGKWYFRGKHVKAHRLSYILNVGEIPKGMLVCHTCDNPSCVRPDHFFLGTHKDNAQDCIKKGRKPEFIPRYGLNNPVSKLNPEKVRQIRKMYSESTDKGRCERIGKLFSVTRCNILAIAKRKTWKDVV